MNQNQNPPEEEKVPELTPEQQRLRAEKGLTNENGWTQISNDEVLAV